MIFLVDHNIEGYALLLLGTLTVGGWIEFTPIQFVMFEEVGLPNTASRSRCLAFCSSQSDDAFNS